MASTLLTTVPGHGLAVSNIMWDMEAKGPAKISDVEASQRTILKVAQKLAAEGRVVLGGKDGEQMV